MTIHIELLRIMLRAREKEKKSMKFAKEHSRILMIVKKTYIFKEIFNYL